MAYRTNAKLRGITDKDGKDVFFSKIVMQATDSLVAQIVKGVGDKFASKGIKLDSKTLTDSTVEMLNQVQHDSYKVINKLVDASVPVRKDVKIEEM